MKKHWIALLFLSSFITLLSCGSDKKKTNTSDEKQLTERIQYDVLIKTPDPEFDWWMQNIEGSKREAFVKTILNLGYSGKVQAYDIFNEPMTPAQVKALDSVPEPISVQDPDDPTKMHDTTVIHKLDIQQITKVRFLEEWYLDENNLVFNKKVCGVMLLKENYGDSLELRGYTPLFWLYFDKDYPAKMK